MAEKLQNINISQGAMRLGIWLGLYQTVKLALFPLALKYPTLTLLLIIVAVGVPFFLWRLVRNFRDNETNGFFPFISAWLLSMMTILFATMISSIVAYLYLRYIDGGSFMTAMAAQMEASKAMIFSGDLPVADTNAAVKTVENVIELFSSMTPLEFTKQIISSTLFWGNLFSIVIALITARIKPIKIE